MEYKNKCYESRKEINMNSRKQSSVIGISILFLLAIFLSATASLADTGFLTMDKDDPNKAVIEIKDNKAYVTIIEVKAGVWSSKILAVNEYCLEEVGIVATDIKGVNLKTDDKLCHCVTKDNYVVLISRGKDGKIKILIDSQGNYIVPIGDKLKDLKTRISGIQLIYASQTPDGRLLIAK
jgi:hypothetical protein